MEIKPSQQGFTPIIILFLGLIFIIIIGGFYLSTKKTTPYQPQPKIAIKNNQSSTSYPYFVPGKTTIVQSMKVGTDGGTLKVENTGTPADGTLIKVHKGALSQEVTLSVGYNDGKVESLRAGKASGTTLVLSTTPQVVFDVAEDGSAVQITVPYDSSSKSLVIAPYAIDEKNRLQPLQLEAIDEVTSHARFATFHPVMFTWVYVH